MALGIPLRKTTLGQKSISFLGPNIRSKVDSDVKELKTTTSFTYSLKKQVLDNLTN